MAYGTAAGVADLSAQWTDSGSFTVSTRPALATVNGWLDDVSAIIDTALADEGFTVPVTLAAVVKELDLLAEGLVKDLCDAAHSTGRFYSERALFSGRSPMVIVDKEIHEWVKRKSVGFENQGVPKTEVGRNVASFDLL